MKESIADILRKMADKLDDKLHDTKKFDAALKKKKLALKAYAKAMATKAPEDEIQKLNEQYLQAYYELLAI